MPLNQLIEYYHLKIKGIIHVGASDGQEAELYKSCGIARVFWIEAIPTVFERLCSRLEYFPGNRAFCACITDKDEEEIIFNITNNNGESSSIFNLKNHKSYYPHIKVVETIQLKTLKLDTLVEREELLIDGQVNFIILDIQGAELLALEGFINNLKFIDYIYLEICIDEYYENGAKVKDINIFLEKQGFSFIAEQRTNMGWGDRLYIRK
ncbi:FkbM family methyltransferase [Mucilaginibacter angelicae]|uniref:FkbM family methyltransferase n=1 Tax=Mucilaginibacter angelicae TaxID=869718 RepID=A0ABV6L0X5_9SPHI